MNLSARGGPDLRARDPLPSLIRGWAQPSLARNVIFNWLSTGAMIAYSLFITPVVVRGLDKQLYGVWSFLNGLLTYTDLLYLGLGAALIKYVAHHLAHRDDAAVNRLGSVVLSIYTVIGLLCLVAAVLVAPLVPRMFAQPLDPASATATTYTCVLLGARVLALFIGSVFAGVLVGADRTDVARVVPIVFTALRFLAIPIFVTGPNPLLALALVVTVSAVIECVVMARLVRVVLSRFKTRWVWPHAPELRVLYGFGLQSFFVLTAVKLISYTDTTVIGVTLGAASVALYALPLQLIEYGRIGVNGIVGVLLPRLSALYAKGDTNRLGEAYLAAALVTCLIAAFLNVNIVFLGVPFLSLWVGPAFGEPTRWVLIFLAAASVLQALSTQVPLPFYQAMHLLRFPAVVLVVEGFANLGLSVAWAPRFGITGVALATALPALAISFLALPRHLCRHLEIPYSRLFRRTLLPVLLSIVTHSATFLLLNYLAQTTSYLALFAKALAAAPGAAIGAGIGLCREDRESALSFAKLGVSRCRQWARRAAGSLP